MCICNHFPAPLALVSVLDSVRVCVPAEHRDLHVLLSTYVLSVLTSLHTVTHRKLPSGMATQHKAQNKYFGKFLACAALEFSCVLPCCIRSIRKSYTTTVKLNAPTWARWALFALTCAFAIVSLRRSPLFPSSILCGCASLLSTATSMCCSRHTSRHRYTL